jgi:hypothetical protein
VNTLDLRRAGALLGLEDDGPAGRHRAVLVVGDRERAATYLALAHLAQVARDGHTLGLGERRVAAIEEQLVRGKHPAVLVGDAV